MIIGMSFDQIKQKTEQIEKRISFSKDLQALIEKYFEPRQDQLTDEGYAQLRKTIAKTFINTEEDLIKSEIDHSVKNHIPNTEKKQLANKIVARSNIDFEDLY